MRIGRDHIASTVYTIAFATAGAVLPVLLVIAIHNRPIFEVLQSEQFATELIRTMVGSIGLVLAVPPHHRDRSRGRSRDRYVLAALSVGARAGRRRGRWWRRCSSA